MEKKFQIKSHKNQDDQNQNYVPGHIKKEKKEKMKISSVTCRAPVNTRLNKKTSEI